MRILFLSAWFPYPPNNGSKIRIYNLLCGLAPYHDVTLLSFTDRPDVNVDTPELRRICHDIQTVPWKPFTPDSRRARLGFFSLKPRSVLDTFSLEMAKQIKHVLATAKYDLVIASQSIMAAYSSYFSDVPSLFEEVEVALLYEQFTRAESLGQRLRYGLTWAKHRYYLADLMSRFQACTVVSQPERGLLHQSVAPNYELLEVIPNCVNVAEYERIYDNPRPNSLIFTGSFTYFANYQAMTWFLSEIYPSIQAQIADVNLMITGDNGNRPLPPATNVELTGFVEDVHPYIASSWVSLVPILAGGGTRLKILEAMALGTPVVATTKGAEGLDVEDNRHILIADSPEDFAEAVIRLLKNADLRQELAENARQLVCHKYDWAAIMPRFLNLIEQVARV